MHTGHSKPEQPTTADESQQLEFDLGRELRRLRDTRRLTQAQTALAVGLSARSAVADYESGRRTPPDDIVANYERAFALEPGTLRRHRDQIHAREAEQRYTEALAAAAAPPDPQSEHAQTHNTRTVQPTPRRLTNRALARTAALIGLSFMLAGSASASGTTIRAVDPTWVALTQNVTNPVIPSTPPEPMDGDDPRARDCYADAVTVQQVPLDLPGGKRFGTLRLRHSARCGTSWGSAYYSNPQLYTIRITVHRPKDDGIIRNDWSNNTPPGSYSDMLSTATGCVWVEAVVITPAATSTPAHTSCAT
jgi:transcriptional regulator with XRE-family HTH domain